MGDTRFAVYRRESQILPAPAARFAIVTEYWLGTRDTWEEAVKFALACRDERVFIREEEKRKAECVPGL